jgi:Helix-turn-helix domain
VSLEQSRRAWAVPDMAPLPRLMLLALADLANDAGGQCFPSQATLARQTGISDRHVRNLLADLIAAGHVTLVRKATGSTSASYQLTLPPLPAATASRQPVPTGTGYRKPDSPLPANGARLPEASAADPSESLRNPTERTGAREGQSPAPGAEAEPRARPFSRTEYEALLAEGRQARAVPKSDPAEIERRRRQAAAIAAECELKARTTAKG